jgi:hypothetical protein
MAFAFNPIPAKPTFGNLKQIVYQSDYLNKKKSKLIYCTNPNICNKFINAKNYNDLYLYNSEKYLNNKFSRVSASKDDLVFALYTKENLKGVCTVQNGFPSTCNSLGYCDSCKTPTIINIASPVPFYDNHTIDPNGQLFGNTYCGVNNFVSYMDGSCDKK